MSRRKSVPTLELQSWWDAGWSYVMPDFDNKNHSVIEWLSEKEPRVPAVNRVPETKTENVNERSNRPQHAD